MSNEENKDYQKEVAATAEVQDVISSEEGLLNSFIEKKSETMIFNSTPKEVNFVIDLGTTGTRDIIIEKGRPLSAKDIAHTPSEFAIVDVAEDFSAYGRTSNRVEDNAEFIIQEMDSEISQTSWFKKPVRVLKMNLIRTLKKPPINLNNQVDKSEDIGTFINLLTSMAMRSFIFRETNVNARVGFILPPKEKYSSAVRLREIIDAVAGVYKVKMPRFGFEVTITIRPGDVEIQAESEVAYIYHVSTGRQALERKKELEDKKVVTIDWGGSTINIGLMENGKLVNAVSHTAKIGAEILVSRMMLILQRNFKEQISEEKAREAVTKGYITMGEDFIPVGHLLTEVKNQLVENLYSEIVRFLQIAGLYGSDIYAYMFLGRGMLGTGKAAVFEGDEIKVPQTPDFSPSMAELLSEKCAKMSPRSKSIIIEKPGIANLLGMANLMRATWGLF